MLWSSLILNEFCNFICRGDNYTALNKINLRFQDTVEIVKSFGDNANDYRQIRDALKANATSFQYLHANDYGIQCRLSFENQLKLYQSQKNILTTWPAPPSYSSTRADPPTPTMDEPLAEATPIIA